MRRVITPLLACLPLEARGRRALDEALLDWKHEEALVSTSWRRVVVEVRALAGLARVMAAAMWMELREIPVGWFLSRTLLLIIVPALLLTATRFIAWSTQMAANVPGWSVPLSVETSLLNLPFFAMWVATRAFGCYFLAIWQPRGRRVPALGLSLGVLAMVGLWAWWIAPESGQRFRERVFHASAGEIGAGPGLARGLNELTLPALVARVADDTSDRLAMNALLTRVGVPLWAAAQVLLGSAVVRRQRRHRIAWAISLPILSTVVSLLTRAVGASFSLYIVLSLTLACALALAQAPNMAANGRSSTANLT